MVRRRIGQRSGKQFAAILLLIFSATAASAEADSGGKSHAGMHHPQASEAAIALHDLMESLWHSAPGASRNAKACGMTKDIKERVKAAATRPVPESAAMIRAAQALEDACTAKNDSGASQEIDRMHQLFYKIAE
jgi:hypothetical protein